MSLSADPDVWFIGNAHGMVTKTSEESTIPCVVTNPNITVTLYDRDTELPVKGLYIPTEGFKARLEDRTYVCRGELNGEVRESDAFNVLSVVGKCSIRETDLPHYLNTNTHTQTKSYPFNISPQTN